MASVITVAFENWKAQEAASGKAVLLDEFVFANVPNLDPTQPIGRDEKLPAANQIVHRQAVNKSGLASENAVAYSVTLGAEVGNFDFNWIGLLNKASGTVAMITHAPLQKKLKTQNGQQGNVLTRSFILEFQGAAEETQIKTSAETWQIDFTARLSGIDEMQRLINVDSYGAAAFFNDGFEVTRSGEQYTVKKGLGYVGGLRGELAQNQILNGLRNTKVYADFSYQGNIVSQWNTVIKITAAATLANYVDAAGFTHQVFAIASIDASGNVKDLRSMGALNSQEISALETRLKLDLSKKIDKANISGVLSNDTTKVPSLNLLATELGKKQAKGDYADGKVFTRADGVESRMYDNAKQGDNRQYFYVGYGWSGVKSKSATLWLFDDKGTLAAGNIPYKRLVDIPIYQSKGNDENGFISQKAVTLELEEKQAKGNYADGDVFARADGVESRMYDNAKQGDNRQYFYVGYGWSGVKSKSATLWLFDDKGTLAAGNIPYKRLVDFPVNTMHKSENGWWKCGQTGLIIQWGKFSGKFNGDMVGFNIPFPAACSSLVVTDAEGASPHGAKVLSKEGFQVILNGNGRLLASWVAIGY
ncbi:phage tail protein [Providencia huaxiensis]|uniref:phage tail-collar fiber domain-containing protein n=1 Tax=Providencia huaxiensis TaxID=2027290 RepID=UPI003D2A87AD